MTEYRVIVSGIMKGRDPVELIRQYHLSETEAKKQFNDIFSRDGVGSGLLETFPLITVTLETFDREWKVENRQVLIR